MALEIFNNLPSALRNNSVTLNIKKNQRLFRKGDEAKYLYLIAQGRFQEISYPVTGEAAVLQILSAGDFIGEYSLSNKVHRSTVIAKTDSQVIAYTKSILLESLAHSPLLLEAIIEILGQKIYELQLRLEWRNISAADRRTLEYIKHQLEKLEQENKAIKTLKVDTPWQEIAAELGFSPSTLSRALAKLEVNQLITRDRNYITLNNNDVA